MQRTVSAWLCGGVCPVRLQASAIRAGMSPGGRKRGSFASTTAVKAGTWAAAARRSARSEERPWAAQVRCDSCNSHRPITLRR